MKLLSAILAIMAILVGIKSSMAITDEPYAGTSASASDARPTDADAHAGPDVSPQDAEPDAGPTDADASAVAEPDATAPTCTCTCPCAANTNASTAAATDTSVDATLTAAETAIRKHVFTNGRIPLEMIDAFNCEEIAEVHDAIWGRHGYFFPDDKQRSDFADRYDGLYISLPHVNAVTIENYLTARDNLNLMLLGRAAYNKGCHRSAPAP